MAVLFKAGAERWTERSEGKEEQAAMVVNMPIRGSCLEASMSGLAGQWMWVVMLSALVIGNASACPALCTCSGVTVDCHGLGLKTMPRNIPRNTERL